MSDVHEEAVDQHHPDHRIVVQLAGQGPLGIELTNPEHRPNRFQLGCPGAFRYARLPVDKGEDVAEVEVIIGVP